MSFNVALSGISVSQKDLNTTANNIANANTTGFKESRAEFGDVFATGQVGQKNRSRIPKKLRKNNTSAVYK